jgi:hypothetical protein
VSAIRFRAFELTTQPRNFSSKVFDGVGGLLRGAPHAPVMPEFRPQYKSDAVTKYNRAVTPLRRAAPKESNEHME